MGFFLLLMFLFAIFVLVLAVQGVKIVKQAEVMIIERLGKFHKVLESGIHFIVPILDKPRAIHWRYLREDYDGSYYITELRNRIDLRETVYDFPRQNVITKDNVNIEINALLYFQITDPKKSVYEIYNLPDAIEKLTQTTLRNVIGELELDECLSSRDRINAKLQDILDEATDKWGVKVNRVELQDINPPHDVRDAMEKQMRAERDRRAKILEAEGEKKSAILKAEGQREAAIAKAEGEKQSRILEAQGLAESIQILADSEAAALRKISEAMGQNGDPASYLVALKYVETLKTLGTGDNNKMVFMPYEATGIMGALGSMKEMLNLKS
ncbi:MAG: SPFH/Band 7/PHB domain protein [Planctomycetota bacterium]|nr:MAG: SPFH/Band 7/PHB domain protein [Planctomycetota bacterium]